MRLLYLWRFIPYYSKMVCVSYFTQHIFLTNDIFTDIEVPTKDNVRSAALIEYLLVNETNILCVGPTGSGKTLTVSAKLSRNMPKKYICDFVTFSARITANQTQVWQESELHIFRTGSEINSTDLFSRRI